MVLIIFKNKYNKNIYSFLPNIFPIIYIKAGNTIIQHIITMIPSNNPVAPDSTISPILF